MKFVGKSTFLLTLLLLIMLIANNTMAIAKEAPSGSVELNDSIENTEQPKVLIAVHRNSYYETKINDIITDVKLWFNANVTLLTSANGTDLTFPYLVQYDMLIYIYPQSTPPISEIEAIKDYVNSGKALLVTATYDAYYTYNLTTLTGIWGFGWYDGEIRDDTNFDYRPYYPLVHEWSNTSVSRLVSENGNLEVKFDGTALYIAGGNTSERKIYIVATGDNDTYVLDESDTTIVEGTDVIYFLAVELSNGAKIFATGSTNMFRSDNPYFYRARDNRKVTKHILGWLLGKEIADFEPPTIEITSPTNMAVIQPGTSYVYWQASDDYGIEKIILLVDGNVTAEYNGTVRNGSITVTAPGWHVIAVKAVDLAGNQAYDAVIVKIVETTSQQGASEGEGVSLVLVGASVVVIIGLGLLTILSIGIQFFRKKTIE